MKYFNMVKDLERKLKSERENLKKEKISAEEENKNLFNAKWKVYKQISPIVKKLLLPLVKALKKMYKVQFNICISGGKKSGHLCVEWEIKIGMKCFSVILPDSQDYLKVERKIWINYFKYEDGFEGKAKLTEESLATLIETGFLDYINSKMV